MISPSKVFSEQLRDAITESGNSLSSIARNAGVSVSALSRFVNGKGGLSVKAMDRLASSVGFRVIPLIDWFTIEVVWRQYERGDLINAEISAD